MVQVQDLTLEEIVWRYNVLNRHLDRILEDAADEYCKKNNTELEDTYLREQICASILYLHKIGATKLVVCKPDSLITNSLFHATKKECIENADKIDDEDIWGPKEHKNIPIPIIFDEKDPDDAFICLVFDFQENSLSGLCKEMIDLLRLWSTTDIDVINMIIFMDSYFSQEKKAYNKCVWNVFLGLFEVDSWESRKQLPWEIMEIIESILRTNDKEIGNLYDPFSRTGMNSILPHNKYYAHIDDVRYYNSVRLFNGIWGQDFENIEFNSCIDNWNPRDCKTIIATPKLDQKVLITEGKYISVGEWVLDKMQSSLNCQNRQAMLVLPANVLYDKGNIEQLRCKLTEANLIDTIILLPHDMIYGTGAATCLLLLSSDRETDKDIMMIDLTSAPMIHEDEEDEDSRLTIDCEEFNRIASEEDPLYYKMVKISDIIKNNYNWYIPSYFIEDTDVPVDYVNIRINDILQDPDCLRRSKFSQQHRTKSVTHESANLNLAQN